MKTIIKGISYDTDKARFVTGLGGRGYDLELYQKHSGQFFTRERRFRVDGKLVPRNIGTDDVLPDLRSPIPEKCVAARKRVTLHDTLTPIPRQKAIALCIKHLIPGTFHKELARFLKAV